MQHSCRKCLVSRNDLESAEQYDDIHAKNHEARNNASFEEDFEESKLLGVTHVNGVGRESVFKDFPYFDVAKMLPQGSFINGLTHLCILLSIDIIYFHIK